MTLRKFTHLAAATALATTGLVGVGIASSSPASAGPCESWSDTLKDGSKGDDVKELQIRVAGWVKSGDVMGVDGVYGDQTTTAVKNFQKAYKLDATGKADSKTFDKLRDLTDSDCTPIHFTYKEASNNCGKGFTGGQTEKKNLRRSLWQAEALRHQLGDHPLKVNSGYRDKACNASVNGATNSQHLTGKGIDLEPLGGSTMCDIAKQSRNAGYGGIFGPGYKGHSNHVHVDHRPDKVWRASQCF